MKIFQLSWGISIKMGVNGFFGYFLTNFLNFLSWEAHDLIMCIHDQKQDVQSRQIPSWSDWHIYICFLHPSVEWSFGHYGSDNIWMSSTQPNFSVWVLMMTFSLSSPSLFCGPFWLLLFLGGYSSFQVYFSNKSY